MKKVQKRSRALALTAAAALVGCALPLLSAEPASAASCLRTVGKVKDLVADGQHIGVFYQGFDQCNKTAYAELHFDTAKASGDVTSTDPYTDNWIQIADREPPGPWLRNSNLPNITP